jgi:hypothetical protein
VNVVALQAPVGLGCYMYIFDTACECIIQRNDSLSNRIGGQLEVLAEYEHCVASKLIVYSGSVRATRFH